MDNNIKNLSIDELEDYLRKTSKDISVKSRELSDLRLRRTKIEIEIKIKKLRADIEI